jgi:hypothetical protein
MPLSIAENEIPGLHDEISKDGSKDWDDYPLLRFIQVPNGPEQKLEALSREALRCCVAIHGCSQRLEARTRSSGGP